MNALLRVVAIAFLLLCRSALTAATFTVSTAADEFDTPSGASVSLREALRDAEGATGPDTIIFAPTLSGQTIVLGSEIAINDPGAVTVDASSLSSRLVIDGGPGNNRIFYIGGSAAVSIVAVKLTGGNGSGSVDPNVGGVAFNNGGSLTLTLCALVNNSAGAGGAIYNHYATLVLDRCSFSGHTAVNGGALASTGSVTAQRCSFTGNTVTGDGGVLFSSDGSVSLSQCTLQGNSAGGDGGAIKNFTQLDLTHCTVTGNSAGGIFGGGAIYHVRHYLTVANSIVAGNSLTGTGFGADIRFDYRFNLCTLTRVGANIIQSLAVGGTGGNPTGPPHIIANPLLAPLNDYGGPTQTMVPLPGSPAIDAAVGSSITTDQRSLPIQDGDGNGSVLADIGAVEANAAIVVQNTNDSGPGSLRQAITDANTQPGPDLITFAPGLSGQSIALNGMADNTYGASALTVSDSGGVTLDATALSGGLTLTASSTGYRAFLVTSGSSLTLRGLTLSGFTGQPVSAGGAILNFGGTLTLTQCALSGNSGFVGGAIFSPGPLTLTKCTLSGNATTSFGGAIYNNGGTLTLMQCTLSGNSASGDGGAIYNNGGTLTLTNSIVAGNTAGSNPNIAGSINTSNGVNLTSGDPLLAPLGNYGGPTPTMALLPTSPARNAAIGSTITFDQRGFAIVFTPDIGAYESGTLNNYNAWIYETLPDTATVPQHASSFDYDGDGVSNGNEWPARTDPGDASSYFHVTQNSFGGGQFNMTVTTVAGRTYSLETSSDLVTWIPTGFGAVSLLGMPVSFSYGPITPTPRLFSA